MQQYGDWHTGCWWVGCHIWYREEGPGRAAAPPSPLLAVQNVTTHPSTASALTSYCSMWHYNYIVPIKGLKWFNHSTGWLKSEIILIASYDFCRAMLCVSAVYAVMWCLCVCLSRSWIMSKPNSIAIFRRDPPPLNGGVECRCGKQKSRFWAYIWL